MEIAEQRNDIYGVEKRISQVVNRIERLGLPNTNEWTVKNPERAKNLYQSKLPCLAMPLTDEDKKLVRDFQTFLYTDGCNGHRVHIHLSKLYNLIKLSSVPISKWTIEDFKKLYSAIMQPTIKWASAGRNMHIITLRKIAKYRFGKKILKNELEELVIVSSKKDKKKKIPKDLVTDKEFNAMLSVCDNARDQAMLMLLWEAGFRVGELANIRIKDIDFKKNATFVRTTGKTGEREVAVLRSTTYLDAWLRVHPNRHDRESFLFVNRAKNFGLPMNYYAISRVVKRVAKKAGIEKRVWNHLFRHGAATKAAKWMTNSFTMDSFFGWELGSAQSKQYINEVNANDEVLKHYGLIEEEKHEDKIECLRCKHLNAVNCRFCTDCGHALTIQVAGDETFKERDIQERLKRLEGLFSEKKTL